VAYRFSSSSGPWEGPEPPAMGLRRRSRLRPARSVLLALAALIGLAGAGCSTAKWTVKPHQRELLADRIMQLDGDAQERAADQHVLSNREGAIGGTGTAGGGCGCN